MEFEWGPESRAHVGKHGLSPAQVEAIFDASDFDAKRMKGGFRMCGHGTVDGRLYLVIFMVDGQDIIGVVTAYRVKKRKHT